MPVSDLNFLSVLILHFQPQVATIMVEIEHTDGVKTLFHSMLTHQFTRIMHAIVVNNHHSVYRKLASIVRIKAESVDSVFRNFQVSGYDQTYISFASLGMQTPSVTYSPLSGASSIPLHQSPG